MWRCLLNSLVTWPNLRCRSDELGTGEVAFAGGFSVAVPAAPLIRCLTSECGRQMAAIPLHVVLVTTYPAAGSRSATVSPRQSLPVTRFPSPDTSLTDSISQIALASFSASISSASKPTSSRTSAVCSPILGTDSVPPSNPSVTFAGYPTRGGSPSVVLMIFLL